MRELAITLPLDHVERILDLGDDYFPPLSRESEDMVALARAEVEQVKEIARGEAQNQA